jgi:serine/threonine protein kinase
LTSSGKPPPVSIRTGLPTLGLPNVGDVLAGKYAVEAVLGVGGMAVVVAARHLELDERVALKILLPKFRKNEEVVKRFRREARAAVKIKSDHMARVFDVGTLDDGAPCLVMEYLEGQDLETLLSDQGPIAAETAVGFVLEACEALAEAHGLGIVHRDLKPANLFLSLGPDGRPIIKLLDFGISKVGGMLTRKQSSFGTPHYMSPEQLLNSEDVDGRADIWAMGAILHELIAGKPPFDSEDLSELQDLIRLSEPRRLRANVPHAPEGLEVVLLRCLEKKRDKRFENVAELARALVPFGGEGSALLAESVGLVAHAASGRQAVTERAAMERPPTPLAFVPVSVPTPSLGLAPREGSDSTRHATKTSIARDAKDSLAPPRSRTKLVAFAGLMALALVGGILGLGRYRADDRRPNASAPPPLTPVETIPSASGIASVPSVTAAIELKAPVVSTTGGKVAGRPAKIVKLSTSPSAKSNVFDDRK